MSTPDRQILELRLRAETDPSNLGVLLDLAAAYERAGLGEEAHGAFQRVLAIDPGNIAARHGRLRHFRLRYARAAAKGDPYERAAIVHQVGELRDRFATLWLVSLLDVAEPVVCQKAAEALGKLGERAAVPALIRLIRNDPACSWWQASEALAAIGDPAAVPPLLITLADHSANARAAAAHALGLLGDHSALDGLVQALGHADPAVRRAAAAALGELGASAGVPALVAALDDPVPETRAAVLASLEALLGRSFHRSLLWAPENRARRWWEQTGQFRHWGRAAPPHAALEARRRHRFLETRRALLLGAITVAFALLVLAAFVALLLSRPQRGSGKPRPTPHTSVVADRP